MKLSKLTEADVRKLAGKTIFDRGNDYYSDGRVENYGYYPDKNRIQANIRGSLGIYSIEIWERNGKIEAYCDCPFEGYPCKHIVAVVLTHLHERKNYQENADRKQKTEELTEAKLLSMSKEELSRMILASMNQYPAFKRDVLMQLAVDKELTIGLFYREIDRIIGELENENFSTYDVAYQLRQVIKQTELAETHMKIEILWKITDGVLYQLSEYGMDDIPLENLAITTLGLLTESLNAGPDFGKRRAEIRNELEKYYESGNCGIIDQIGEAAMELVD